MIQQSLPPILIVDDESADRVIACRLIAKAHVANPMILARDGQEAITLLESAIAAKQLPRAVFLDSTMPGMDGFAVLRWIRQQTPLKYLPVVMFTTFRVGDEVRKAVALGASLWCEKFPSPAKLRSIVERLFGGR